MNEDLKTAFCNAKYTPNGSLSLDICQSIEAREKRTSRVKFFGFSIIGIASVISIVPAFNMLASDFTQSGFSQYLSLLSSPTKISTYWQELSLSLVESLPTFSIIIVLSLVFTFLLSLKFTMKQVTKGHLALT